MIEKDDQILIEKIGNGVMITKHSNSHVGSLGSNEDILAFNKQMDFADWIHNHFDFTVVDHIELLGGGAP